MIATDVLIIGAGAAGLSAAKDLSAAGLTVIVVEAGSRVGGRILTHHDPGESIPLELGAEFIHGKAPELFSIINDAGLRYEEVTTRHWYFESGRLVKSYDFWSQIEKLMEEMKSEITDKSFEAFLKSQEVPPRVKTMARTFVEGFHAAQSDRVGINGLMAANQASDQIDGDRLFRLLDGYDGVATVLRDEAISRGIQFKFNTRVVELRWSNNQVEAVCTSDSDGVLQAQKALITVPLSILKLEPSEQGSIKFLPKLPTLKLEAIRSLDMGAALRIVLRFTHCFWESLKLTGAEDEDLRQLGFIHHPDAALPTWWTTLPEREPILVGWAGGPTARQLLTLSTDELESKAMESLSSMFAIEIGVLRTYLVKSYFHNWQFDPLARGAYSYPTVGGLEHQLNLAKSVEGTLFFAGEATSLGHFGTVHGAIQSGQRAAREVLTHTA